MKLRVWRNNQFTSWQPNVWDVIALLILFSVFVLFAWGAKQMTSPYHLGEALPISLSPKYLPGYALRTVFRMAIGLLLSLLFTFTIGNLAARSKHAERIIIPIIDILQSVPVLGFLSITIVGFIWLFPNSLLGPECASIFVIFTAQAWNMCLGFYQSLRILPYELREAAAVFQLSSWQRFWRMEVPFAMPSLIWNMMMSLSASWFFVVASEAISVNNQSIMLPGIGSYIAVAIKHYDKTSLCYVIATMLIIILLYDQLLFRPLIKWSEKFKTESSADESKTTSLLISLLHRTRLLHYAGYFLDAAIDAFINFNFFRTPASFKSLRPIKKSRATSVFVFLWYGFISAVSLTILWFLLNFIFRSLTAQEALHVITLGLYTSIRIVILISLCSLIWVPIGVWVGLNPRATKIAQPIAQFFAAFPANLLFPVVVILIVKYKLNIQVWTAPLMILGTQWYILFNVIAGASSLPKDLLYVTQNFGVKNWVWWKRFILPGIFPYFITGAITAAGGAWNASIIAEIVSWGNTTLKVQGLGAYITEFTKTGDFPRIALGISIMCLYVLIFNRLLWQPLYNLAEKRFQIN